uniref:Family with sequence similarity 177 member B n=1 Tax=Leptobrachium leishanense TaxID=445787 RepID=A0A8C5MQ48_9ANUR
MSDTDITLKEMEDLEKHRVPRRIIHFASGEILEEYSTDEEEEEEEEEYVDFQTLDTSQMNWKTYIQFWMLRVSSAVFFTCEFLGGKLATLFGLNVPKYQYAIDEYYRTQDESDDEDDVQHDTEARPANALYETHHLQAQTVEYGTITCHDIRTDKGDTF